MRRKIKEYELLDCPLCKGEAILGVWEDKYSACGNVAVMCHHCGLVLFGADGSNDDVGDYTDEEIEAVVNRWNDR